MIEPDTNAQTYLERAEKIAGDLPGAAWQTRSLDRVAVIGAGTMGAGIAVSLADGGLRVDLLERDAAASNAGAERVRNIYAARVKRGRIDEATAQSRQQQVTSGFDWSVVSDVDLVVEAAFEDMTVKQDIFARLAGIARPDAILATNTSYLDIDQIAAVTRHPENVLGLHFFSPAHVMRLLEVVQARRTSEEALAACLELGRRIGKLPIVAKVSDGFIGNRIFAIYRRHAEYLLEDGASVQDIDAALKAYGFAMGPFEVSDMSGLDIARAMRQRRAATRDPLERYVDIPDRLCDAGRLGRKAGRGWYDYIDGKPVPSNEADTLITQERRRKSINPRSFTAEEIQHRILAVMANEGAKILAEGISLRPSDIDLVFVNGYGFPAGKGGPMFAADRRGLDTLLRNVQEASQVGGAGSDPAPLLIELARSGGSFQAWQAAKTEI
ncbi:3-hydroxyacyl-CoA dehydrogenase [Falsirhodobacter xinxiangensis]|uniref:3-hydroxyacyl-CoA dehydrogenase n=1 Tax=Falsirhodobacter xinxiangensis TaxID=2530049 RepID=UPI0010AA5B7C|nr:3-hydroxyacyl-CoA dehydrogenase [Rhodobacter xinxiangensis]